MKKNKRSKGSIFMAIILILSILVPNIVFADEHLITLEAESLSDSYGIEIESCNEGGKNIGYIENDDWIKFDDVDFKDGTSRLEFRVSSDTKGGEIEIRLGSITGELIGTAIVPNTGGWQNYITIGCDITKTSGKQDLYLVFKGENGYLLNINYIQFSVLREIIQATSKITTDNIDDSHNIQLQHCSEGGKSISYINDNDWAIFNDIDFSDGVSKAEFRVASDMNGGKVEIRLGDMNGELIGTAVVPNTGGWQKYITVSCDISDVTGIQDICLVFKGEDKYLYNLSFFTFVKQIDNEEEQIPEKDPTNNESTELPENVRYDRDDYNTIKNVVDKYKSINPNNVSFTSHVNSDTVLLNRITFGNYSSDPINVDGEIIIDLPGEVVRILRFFTDLRFNGSIVPNLSVSIENPRGEKRSLKLGGSWQEGNSGCYTTFFKNNKLGSLDIGLDKPYMIKGEDGNPLYDGYKLILKGTGTINSIYLWYESTGINLDKPFDTSEYEVVGQNKPILDRVINIDITKNLSLDGENKFDDEKFLNAYGSGTSFNPTADKITPYGFNLGRGMTKLRDAYEVPGNIKEDINKPGYTDYSYFDTLDVNTEKMIDTFDRENPLIGNNHVQCLDNWPTWQVIDGDTGTYKYRGTPLYERFNAAAELAGKVVESFTTRLGDRAPKYIEVKNESNISSEWGYHETEPTKAWDYLAEFHNKVSKEIKKVSPDTMVGGPATAILKLENNGFKTTYEMNEFMNATKDDIDFYSNHFYEDGSTMITNDDGDSNPRGYLAGGRIDATLDYLQSYMNNTNNKKPLIISEFGSLAGGGTDFSYWNILKSVNSYQVNFMNRANNFAKVVPFILPIKWWDKDSKDMMFLYDKDNECVGEATPLFNYVKLWSGYKGAYLPVETDDNRLVSNATRQGNKVYVAVNNLVPNRINTDLNLNLGNAKITDIKRKSMYFEYGKLEYKEEKIDSLQDIYMRVDETSIFEITLDTNVEYTNTILRKVSYADKTLIDTGITPSVVTINTDINDINKSILRVGFGKDKYGFSSDLSVNINGKEYTADLEYTNKVGGVVSYVDFEIDPTIIKNNNTITVSIPEKGGKILSVQLTNDYLKGKPVGVDTSPLENLILDAKDKIDGVKISSTGKELKAGDRYVPSDVMNSYTLVIEKAEIVFKDNIASRDEVEDSIEELKNIGKMFERNIKAI